jgi:hypothetical protein
MTKTPLITKAEVRKALRHLIVTQPDTRNPKRVNDPNVCAYHRGRGANIKRCIAGQIGYDFGLPIPSANAGAVGQITGEDAVWGGRFTLTAIEQKIAVGDAWIED